MRKNTVLKIIDSAVWLLIALIPVLGYLLQFLSGSDSFTAVSAFSTFMTNNFAISGSNSILTFFNSLFSSSYNFSLNAGLPVFLTWFVMVELAHMAVDLLLFMPRLALGVMDKYVK